MYIIAAVVTLALLSIIPFSVLIDGYREKKIKTVGGRVGIVNLSDHRVAIHLMGHDSFGVVVRDYLLSPGDQYVIQDSMSEDEVLAFPPEGFVDSAILVFDDSVAMRHGPREQFGIYPWTADYDDHHIENRVHWCYEPLRAGKTISGRGVGRDFYRPVRRYTLTNKDYERAVKCPVTSGL